MRAVDLADEDAPQTADEELRGLRGRVIRSLERTGRYPTWVLVAALAGMFATSFPVTILTVSLGDMARELGTTETNLSWVLSAPLLASAVVLPVLGRMGDLHGHRRVFLIGFSLSTLTAFLTALAWDATSLIALRTLTQVIGAATLPTSMALIVSVFRPADRVKAMGYWSLVGAAAPAVGLVVGGPMIESLGWRLVFVLQAGLGLIALALATVVLRETVKREADGFDIAGAAAIAVGVGGAMVALTQGVNWGWDHPVVLAAAVVAPIGMVTFVRVERRAATPLLPLEYFADQSFRASALTVFFAGVAYQGAFVFAPLVVRFEFGYSLSATALVMLIRPVTLSLASPVGGSMSVRYGERLTTVVGSALFAVSMAVFVVAPLLRSVELICLALALQGIGHGMSNPPLTAAMANAVGEGDFGIVAAAQRLVQQVGAALGITAFTVAYAGVNEAGPFARAFALGTVFAAVALLTSSRIESADRAEERQAVVEPALA